MNIVISFRDFLRNQLTDPASRTDNWIFDNFPRGEFSKDPIITVVGMNSSSAPNGLNNSCWLGTQLIQIDIWVRDDVGYTIDNVTYYDKDLIIVLADTLEKKIRTNWMLLPISLIDMTDRTPISFNADKLIWNISLTYEVQALE